MLEFFTKIAVLFFGFSGLLKAEVLTDKGLREMAGGRSPSLQQIEASFLAAKSQSLAIEERYAFSINGGAQIFSSDEPLLGQFDGGVVQRANNFSLGVNRSTKYGVDLGLKLFGDKNSNAFIEDASTTGVSLNFSMDLFKNFWGRQSKSELNKSDLALKRAKLEKHNQVKTFESNIRKIYWALVANNEQKLLLTSLVNSANKQYRESKSRFRSGVSDSGEVARYRSIWTTKKADLLSLEYQKLSLMSSLKELLPDLVGKELSIGKYSLKQTTEKVLECAAEISSFEKAPMQFTNFDEIVRLMGEEHAFAKKLNKHYDSPDVKVVGEYARVGRDFTYTDASRGLSDNPGERHSIGLQVSIPLGGSKKKTKETLDLISDNQYRAMAEQHLARIKSFHKKTSQMVKILVQVIANEAETSRAIAKSLKVSRKKFKQARISLQELISEEDSELQAKLSEIQTSLTIINTMMDYFSIYSELPCSFNRG